MKKNKDKAYYLNLNYIPLIKKEDDYFIAYYYEYPYVVGTGENEIEALFDLRDAFESVIDVSLSYGDPIIEPSKRRK